MVALQVMYDPASPRQHAHHISQSISDNQFDSDSSYTHKYVSIQPGADSDSNALDGVGA